MTKHQKRRRQAARQRTAARIAIMAGAAAPGAIAIATLAAIIIGAAG